MVRILTDLHDFSKQIISFNLEDSKPGLSNTLMLHTVMFSLSNIL